MKKPTSNAAKGRVSEIQPRDLRRVDPTKFKPDPSTKEWYTLFKTKFPSIGPGAIFFLPIDTLSPTKTIGKGRTNITLIMANLVQTDAATPYAGFDMTATPSRKPVAQIHFEAAPYGITGTANYVISFAIEVVGKATFFLAGTSQLANGGLKTVTGKTSLSLVFNNVKPTDQIFANIEQRSGGSWNWYSARISPPPLVFTL